MEDSNMNAPVGGKSAMGWILAAIVIVVAILAVLFWRPDTNSDNGAANNEAMMADENQDQNTDQNSDMIDDGEVKTFTVTARPFSFDPTEIRVKKGDRVKIVFSNAQGFHDWVIDEFSAKTPQINSGESAEVEFVADKAGTFEYYCSVSNHRAMGMVGQLIVEE